MVKKKVVELKKPKPLVKRGRPPVWGPEKKFNKTIRLSESQEIAIYENFPTLQSFFEDAYQRFSDRLKRKKTA
tara:strand:- start:111 stop:329 length:219 start_codon:yes stop_codon:yes gene_type:complete